MAIGHALFDISAAASGPWRMIGLSGIFAVGIVALWVLRTLAASLGWFLAAVARGVLRLGGVMLVAYLVIGFAMFQPANAFFRLQFAAILTTQAALHDAACRPDTGKHALTGFWRRR